MKNHRLLLALFVVLLLAVAFCFWPGGGERAASGAAREATTEQRVLAVKKGADKPSEPRVVSEAEQRTLARLAEWPQTYAAAAPTARPALLAEGQRQALTRRAVMERLIQRDPREALRRAVTLEVWRALPPELQEHVEEPFSALAHFRVLPVCAGKGGAGEPTREVVRLTEIAGRPVLDSYVFGRREALSTKENAPVQGIRLGGLAALREEVLHALEPREVAVAEASYPAANPRPGRDFATGQPLGDDALTALAGGKVFQFANRASLDDFNTRLAALDTRPDPHSGTAVLFLAAPAAGEEGAGFDLAGAAEQSASMASAWTETKKKVFIIRCDFSDRPHPTYPVVAPGAYATLLNTTVSNTIRDFSYGKTWIEGSTSTTVIRVPQTAAFYATDPGSGTTNNTQLLADAKAAHLTANPGFNYANYDIVGVWFVSIGMKNGGQTYTGLAGGSDIWIQGSSDASVHIHEFGHNYGLGHSSFWTPPFGSTNPIDPAGTSSEYGDPFDIMGSGPVPEGVFHSEGKQRLNWLATGEWTDATAGGSGTYRIYRIDDANATGARGLRVTRAADSYYWLSYRRQFANAWLKAGANIVWKRPSQSRSWLIDTTPGTLAGTSDRTDGSVAIGSTFADAAANVYVTPLARGGTGAGEYLDVRVNIGPYAGNAAPTATISGPSTIPARQTCVFTAQAADANGDTLAYAWDFGQGFTFDNNPSSTFAWNSGGTFTVKVRVSDMKGQSVLATKVVTVTDPITTWNTRANTSVGDFRALVASPTKVLAVGEDYTTFKGPVATSTDGLTWTATQLGNNQQAFGGVWDGTQFLLAGMDYNFSIPDWAGCVFTSPTANAGTWTRRIYAGSKLRGIAFGGGVYVAVGDAGTIQRSTNGTTWTLVTSGTVNDLEGVAYGGGQFVAVGRDPAGSGNGTVLTSPDGTTWTNTSAGAGLASWHDLRSVIWAGDRFVSCGWYSKLRHSLDLGATFTTARTRTEDTPALAYGNGVWFAAGVDKDAADADIDLVSTDGANWTTLTTPSLNDRNAAIFFNNTFITAGDNHSIRQSGTVNPAATGYLAWRETYFPDHGPLSTVTTDGDGDGAANLLEYAFGTNPVLTSGGSITLSGATITHRGVATTWLQNITNGVDYRALFGRRKDYAAAGMTYTVQFSPDLATWENSTATPTVLASDAEFDAVTVPYPFFVNGRKARFFRVEVSLP